MQTRELGLVDYAETWQAMRRYTDQRTAASDDQLWLLQHHAVFTQGQAGKPEHVLTPGAIPIVQTDRGGQVTYHGPGQCVVYVLYDLRRSGQGVRWLVDVIEQSVIAALAAYGISAANRRDAPGVYVGDAKIASLGLRVRRGCSYHGVSLNVDMDTEPFSRINPCGYEGLRVTQLAQLLPPAAMPSTGEAGRLLVEELASRLAATEAQP